MRALIHAASVAAALGLGLAGCFKTPKPECAFRCGEEGACPSDYSCASDGWCKRADLPDSHTCEAPPDDDAGTSDAAVDAAVDAAFDAAPDGMPDADTTDAATCISLAPDDDGSGAARRALVLSEVNPGDYIEVFNDTAAPIDLDSVAYQLVAGAAAVDVSVAGAGVTVPPAGFAELDWPAALTDPVDAGGEVHLALDGTAEPDGSDVMDFVCWGTPATTTGKDLAELGGKWDAAAPCAGALTMGAIHRAVSTIGTSAGSYDVDDAPSPTTCGP